MKGDMREDRNCRELDDIAMEEEEESPGWLTSYSDIMTDLLAIFVLLFSFATLA
nr:MAG: hypothetical protein DIU64_11700 [Caldicoprobacter oshimai]